MNIAIIGAGLAGMACARALAGSGWTVRLFDKGRAPGGRVGTRRVGDLRFDHGAQYLGRRGEAFAHALAGAPLASWPDADRVVGVPGMSAVARHLATGLDIRTGCEILALDGGPGAWTLRHGAGTEGPFDAVLGAVPPVQAAWLLGPASPGLAATLAPVSLAPCWTLMAAFAARLALPDAMRSLSPAIGWAARDSAKPGRDAAAEAWVVQAAPDWSRAQLEQPADFVREALLAALTELAEGALPPALHASVHRWRYAAVERPLGQPCLWDPERRIGLAGDWCIGARAEAAFDSGRALAAAIRA